MVPLDQPAFMSDSELHLEAKITIAIWDLLCADKLFTKALTVSNPITDTEVVQVLFRARLLLEALR